MTSTVPVAEGDLLLEKYRVERVLGRGGMGVVVAATHVDLDQKVALKFLLPEALHHPQTVERFAREAKAAARIHSPHAVRVLDTGKMESGTPFMVMEYLEGRDLSEILDREGALEPAVAVDYVLQACEALAEAHAAGIVHRDLKPANLFLAKQADRRSIIKVLDFGISKLVGENVSPLTHSSTILGSAQYMSPEQLVSSKTVDARADIWALGVILYELIGGKRPFDGETMPEVIGQILQNRPERLSKLAPNVTLDLELVIGRCMSRAPERYESVAVLASALTAFSRDPSAVVGAAERMRRILGGASLPPSPLAADPKDVPVDNAFATGPTVPPPGRAGPSTKVSGVAATSASEAVSPVVVEEPVATKKEPVVEAVVTPAEVVAPAAATTAPDAPARSRWPLYVVAAVVLVGAPVAWWGRTRDAGRPEAPAASAAPSVTATTEGAKPETPLAVVSSSPALSSERPSAVPTAAVPSAAASSARAPVRTAPKPAPSPPPSPPSAEPKKSPLDMGIK